MLRIHDSIIMEYFVMLAFLAILCPPIAVALVGRASQTFTNLGLTSLLIIPGMFHALSVVAKHRVEQRNETLMDIASRYYA